MFTIFINKKNKMGYLGKKSRRNIINSIGKKVHKAEDFGMKQGRRIDVTARKVKNTANRIAGALDAVEEYSDGIPVLHQANLAARDLAKGVSASAQEVRKGGQYLEKKSKERHSDDISEKMKNFI